jgi:hypothetical protein
VRAAIAPSPQWLMQASFGKLKEPETAHPGEDERRFVTAAHFRPFGHGQVQRQDARGSPDAHRLAG